MVCMVRRGVAQLYGEEDTKPDSNFQVLVFLRFFKERPFHGKTQK